MRIKFPQAVFLSVILHGILLFLSLCLHQAPNEKFHITIQIEIVESLQDTGVSRVEPLSKSKEPSKTNQFQQQEKKEREQSQKNVTRTQDSLMRNSRARSYAPSADSNQNSEHDSGLSLGHLGVSIPGLKNSAPEAAEGPGESETGQDLLDNTGMRGESALKAAQDKNIGLYQYLYRRIDAILTYPSEIHSIWKQGAVKARIHFNAKGEYVREKSQFQAMDDFLRVLILRTLRRALVDEIPSGINHTGKAFDIHCSFIFAITQNGDQDLAEAQRFILGNKLFFYRFVYKSKLQWQAGPLSGLGGFGVGFNPLWLVEKGLDLFSTKTKAKISELDKYRDDPEW